MAFGNLKFDTLTTSDAKNTNTEKSLDTSYIFNGTSKTWNTLDGTGTIGILDSLNIASVTDRATGRYTHTFTANMGNTNYCSTNGSSRNGLFSTTVEGDSSYEAATGSVPTASTYNYTLGSGDLA